MQDHDDDIAREPENLERIKKEYTVPRLMTHGTVETVTEGLSLPGDDTFTGSTPG